MSNIQLEITEPYNGQFVTFTAPCDCDAVTDGLVINGQIYTVVDAMGECVTGSGGVWVNGAKVSVVLDVNNRKAFLQTSPVTNKASIAYVDEKYDELKKSVGDGKTKVANAITAKGVNTATDAEFATMATNIGKIETGKLSKSGANTESLTVNKHYGATGYQLLCSKTISKPFKAIRFTAKHTHADSGTWDYSDIFLPFYKLKIKDYRHDNEKNQFVIESFTPTDKTLVDDIYLWYENDEGGTHGSSNITYIQFSSDYKTVYFYVKLTDGENNDYGSTTVFDLEYYY